MSLQRFCSSIVSCFRGKFISRRVLPVLLCFSLFSVPSFAADYNSNTLILSDGQVLMFNQSGNNDAVDYTSSIVIDRATVSGSDVLYNRIYNNNAEYYKTGYSKFVTFTNNFTVKSNHTYNVNFKSCINSNIHYNLDIFVFVYDGNHNVTKRIPLYSYTSDGVAYSVSDHNFDFNLSKSDLPAGYSLQFAIIVESSQKAGNYFKFLITDVNYTDTDDSTGLLNTIISAIGVVWNSIKDTAADIRTGFSNLGTTISNKFSELGNKISNSFDNLNQWLISVKDSIVGKLTEVKDGINNKLQELKDKLAQQIAQIKEDIRSLFVPSDGYFNDKRGELDTFFNEHFGALYQGPTILVNLIKKLVTISPQEPGITLPAIEFMWQGKKVSLTEPIHYSFSWVNDAAHPLHFAYTFYRGFITVVMFVAFVTYLKNKYSYIFER